MESPGLAVKTTSDPFEGQKHDSLLQAARALVDERRLAEMKQQADRAKAEQNYRKQQRLFQFVRVTVAEEVKVTFAPRSEAGVETTCCGQCSGLLADRSTQLAAVICHPWGPLGGSMTDVTVSEITREFETAGISTLRINFRTGIGRGHSAAEDVRGACALLSSLDVPPRRILLVGYSYGSMVVADVADSIAMVAAFAIVAPPLGAAGPLFFGRDVMRSAQQSTKPKLALIGNADQFCTERRFTVFARQMSAPAQSYVVSDETSSAFPQQQCCSQVRASSRHSSPLTHAHAHAHAHTLARTHPHTSLRHPLWMADGSTV